MGLTVVEAPPIVLELALVMMLALVHGVVAVSFFFFVVAVDVVSAYVALESSVMELVVPV